MANFILIFLCLALGFVLKRSGRFPTGAPQALNAFVIYVSLPAVILVQIPALLGRMHFDSQMWIPASMAWLQFGLAFFFFRALGKILGFKHVEIGALILVAGLGNTSFVGIPLLEALRGPEAVPVAILCDQLGSFMVLSILGVMVAMAYSTREGRTLSMRQRLFNIATFPPFFSLCLAGVWYLTGTSDSEFATSVLNRLGITLVPLALIAVGLQLRFSFALFRKIWRPLSLGLAFKLVLSPLFFLALYRGVMGSNAFSTDITILESAMAPMITAAVVAEDFGLDKDIANLMVGLGVPLSIVSVSLWNYFLT